MTKDEMPQPDGTMAPKPTLFQSVAAMVAGVIAVKIVTYAVVTGWRLVTREDPPELEQDVSAAKKAAWLGIIAAATGIARQLARDAVKPPTAGAA